MGQYIDFSYFMVRYPRIYHEEPEFLGIKE